MVGTDAPGTAEPGAAESSDDPASAAGWDLLRSHDGAAALVRAAVALDPEGEYTRSELSDAAGVPYKTLYVSEALEALVDAGLFERVEGDGESEATYAVDADGPVYEAAVAFGEAVARDGRSDRA